MLWRDPLNLNGVRFESSKPVWALCHGESEDHRLGVINYEPELGVSGYPLTDSGAQEIARVIAKEASLREGRVAIVSCPYLRAVESAQIAGEILDERIGTDPRLSPRALDGLEGEPVQELVALRESDAGAAEESGPEHESLDSVRERAEESLRDALAWDGFDQVLLVSHGEVLGVLASAFEGRPLDSGSPRFLIGELRRLS